MASDSFIGFLAILCISLLGCSTKADADDRWQPPVVTVEQQRANEELWRNKVRIGNSSIWMWKSQYEKLMNEGELPGGPGITLRGPISKNDVLIFQKLLAPYLDKNYFKRNPKPKWYKPNPYDEGYWVDLDSEGGDVYAAMAIGRMFRKARVYASVGPFGKCLSSCVLLLAGSVKRWIGGGPVGIHRPYAADTEGVSFEEMQRRTTKLGVDVSAYLSEMNIPTSLYESMKLIPPEKMKILSPSELEIFGLSVIDPVFAELNDNREANLARVSKTEYLARKASFEQCKRESYERLSRASNDGEVDLLEYAKMSRKCEEKTIYKDVINK